MPADLIRAVEAAYDLRVTHDEWLRGIISPLSPSLGLGYGLSATLWHRAGSAVAPSHGGPHVTCPSEVAGVLDRITHALPPEMVEAWCSPASRIDHFGLDAASAAVLDGIAATVDSALPVRSVFALSVGDGAGAGCAVAAPSARRVALTSRQLRTWRRVGAHLASGLRLRMSLECDGAAPAAVLREDGSVVDATPIAARRDTRAALRAAVEQMHRARGRLRETNPEECLDLWRALIDGRFSVVDWVDTDGRRFLVAYDNGVAVRDPRALSAQERGVAEYFARGVSNAEIAYCMGLAPGTVSRLARNVLRKLGCERRADLAALFGGASLLTNRPTQTPTPQPYDDAPPLVVIGPATRNTELLEQLTPAQREVIGLALAGHSDVQIATQRGVSTRTVSGQLASAYARLSCATRSELSALFGAAPTNAKHA